jgi:hypothetical protein
MSHGKRTKKDVEEAYRRGFEAGFKVRPNPLAMILRDLWKKHEAKKLRKAWEENVKARASISPRPIGFIERFEEDERGISAQIRLNGD